MTVKKLEQLSEITDHVLSGLQADESLKHRIYQKAADISEMPEKKISRMPLIALCAISAVMIGVFVLLGRVTPMSGNPNDEQQSVRIQTISAGVTLTESPIEEEENKEAEPSGEDSADDNVSQDEEQSDMIQKTADP